MASTKTPTLTLPHSTFAKVAPGSYLSAYLTSDNQPGVVRPNGRGLAEFRKAAINTGSLSHCAGSAVVRSGATAAVCGIQAEILNNSSIPNPPRPQDAKLSAQARRRIDTDEMASLNLLVPNVELATGCSPAHLPAGGGPPSREAQSLSLRILALLLSSNPVRLNDLKITYTPEPNDPAAEDTNAGESESEEAQLPEVKAYWVLYISIHVLSLSGFSSLFDVAWASIMAALQDIKLPQAWWDPDLESIVCSDLSNEAHKLNLDARPYACTWGVFEVEHASILQQPSENGKLTEDMLTFGDERKAYVLADPDDLEDPLCLETLTVVLDGRGTKGPRVMKIEKSGGIALDPEMTKNLVSKSLDKWKDWNSAISLATVSSAQYKHNEE